MTLRRFENKARQSWWKIHIEAWRQSGLSRAKYCRQHGLKTTTFGRWLRCLAGEEQARKHTEYQAELRRQQRREAEEKRRKRRSRFRFGVSTDARSRALQAFWAMHVEAMNWSAMSVREYAVAMRLSPTSLRKWRERLDDGEVDIDWRAHLHPSARPVVGTNSANRTPPETALTAAPRDDPAPPRQPLRRFFTDEQKRAIVLESDQPGVSVSQVARKHGIVAGLLFRWRVQFGVAQTKRAKLAPVALTDDATAILRLRDLVQPPNGMTAIDLPHGRRVFAPAGVDPQAVRERVVGKGAAS